MTTISASEVAELRKQTGAGLMDCKKALLESGGDYEGALDYLRKKGQKIAEKRADKTASEGVVVTLIDSSGTVGVVMALSCETDFVAKNEAFIDIANRLAKLALDSKAESPEDLSKLTIDGMTVEERLVEQTAKTGEKVVVSALHRLVGEKLATYVHAGSKIGVLVSYTDGGKEGSAEFFRGMAMHIAAMSPSIMNYTEFDAEYVSKETEGKQSRVKIENEDRARLGKPLLTIPTYVSRLQITPEVIAKVEEDIKAELRAEGKPEKIWDKILPGKIQRYYDDNTSLDQERCLLNQKFALDDTKTVEDAIKQFSEKAAVVAYHRVAVG
jgi:elongation factor Ts